MAVCHLTGACITSMSRWNVPGAFFCPNGIQANQYTPWWDVKVVSFRLLRRSLLASTPFMGRVWRMTVDFLSIFMYSCNLGIGYESRWCTSIAHLYSTQKRDALSSLVRNTRFVDNLIVTVSMIFSTSILAISTHWNSCVSVSAQ